MLGPRSSGLRADAGSRKSRPLNRAGSQPGRPQCRHGQFHWTAIHSSHQASSRVFDPLAFLTERRTHIPDLYEKTALSYSSYLNRTRGFRKAHGLLPPATPAQPVPEADRAPLVLCQAWARLIRTSYEVDPLRCSCCGATMQVIAMIEDEEVIYRILAPLHVLSSGDGP